MKGISKLMIALLAIGTLFFVSCQQEVESKIEYRDKIEYKDKKYVDAVTFTLNRNEDGSIVTVIMETGTPDAEIYYSTDGSVPTINSKHYENPLNLNKDSNISAIAVKEGMENSPVSKTSILVRKQNNESNNNNSQQKEILCTLKTGTTSGNIIEFFNDAKIKGYYNALFFLPSKNPPSEKWTVIKWDTEEKYVKLWYDEDLLTIFFYADDVTTENATKLIAFPKYSHQMFFGLDNAIEIDLTCFDTSEVTDMSNMFRECNNVMRLDLSNFNTSKLVDIEGMFCNCYRLMELNLSGFDTHNVKVTYNGGSGVFSGCKRLKTLDLTSFDLSNAKSISIMFSGCSELTTIYVSEKFKIPSYTNDYGVFNGCTKLTGGAGTVYDENHKGVSYAHVDGGTENPGYLTLVTIE